MAMAAEMALNSHQSKRKHYCHCLHVLWSLVKVGHNAMSNQCISFQRIFKRNFSQILRPQHIPLYHHCFQSSIFHRNFTKFEQKIISRGECPPQLRLPYNMESLLHHYIIYDFGPNLKFGELLLKYIRFDKGSGKVRPKYGRTWKGSANVLLHSNAFLLGRPPKVHCMLWTTFMMMH